MRYKAADIKKLLEEVALKSGMTLEYASFKEIYSKMEEALGDLPFKEDYLYKRVMPEIKKQKKIISLNANYVEHLVKYLQFNNYDAFLKAKPFHPVLENCVGNWYSYVRCNSGQDYVLISPVRIFQEGREINILLKGKVRTFAGKLKFEGSCLYCLLESNEDKNLHLVFNIGFAKIPNVLQGVFSGMSTAGNPIAGREVLIRQEEKFGALQNSRRPIAELVKSNKEIEKLIGLYFSSAERNILKAGMASTYELDDLEKK